MSSSTRGIYRGRLWLLASLIVLGMQSGPARILGSSSQSTAAAQSQPHDPSPHDESAEHFVYFATFIHSGDVPITFSRFVYLPSALNQDGPELSHANGVARVAASRQTDETPLKLESELTIQNLSMSDPAQITISPYHQDFTPLPTTSDEIAAGSMKQYPGDTLVSPNFNGAIVVSSNQAIAAIVTVVSDDGAAGRATYEGTASGSTEAVMPLVKHNLGGFTTNTYVQNAGVQPTTITMAYTRANGNASCTAFVTMKPGRGYAFDAIAQQGCVPSGFVGSVVITSTLPSVVATALELGNNAASAYNGIISNQAGTKLAVPLVLHNSQFAASTTFAIQNTSSSASTNVEIRYMASGPGSSCTQSVTLPPGPNLGADVSAFLASNPACQGSGGWAGSATMSSDLPILASVLFSGQRDIAAYNAFNPANATSKMALPLVTRNDSGFTSGISIMNVGTSPVTITCSFSNGSQTATKSNVAPDEIATFDLDDTSLVNLPDGYRGSAICTSQPNQPIVGVVSSANALGAAALYDCINY